MKRAGTKWKRNWGARLRRAKKRVTRRGEGDDGGDGKWEKVGSVKKMAV
jgi:hypothetical protein